MKKHSRSNLVTSALVTLVAASACGGSAVSESSSAAPRAAERVDCDPRQDQAAIARMAGSYDVVFDFDETEVLTPGYQRIPGHETYATELVILLESTPHRVSLQHVLQVGPNPRDIVKHWRQDWAFESRELWEYQGKETWQKRHLNADEAACTWTQSVYGVDDGPRYAGFGRWRHVPAGAVWQSNQTWRPLPRREYSTRSDYDVLVAVNRHRITSEGWDHEQDNGKLVLEPRHTLVRERGLNRYTRTKAADTSVAASYWQRTAPFWADVRAEWARVLGARERLTVRTEATGKNLHAPLFERAEAKPASQDPETVAFIQATIGSYLVGR